MLPKGGGLTSGGGVDMGIYFTQAASTRRIASRRDLKMHRYIPMTRVRS